jgi:hypothetical protein
MRADVYRLLDTMIFVYFGEEYLLDELVELPNLALTSSVLRELRSWSAIHNRVQEALGSGHLRLCDFDPSDTVEATRFAIYSGSYRLGEGEATSMAVASARGFTFVSHDREAILKTGMAGVRVSDWPELLEEMATTGVVSSGRAAAATARIRKRLKI